jgi:hypothetical protein
MNKIIISAFAILLSTASNAQEVFSPSSNIKLDFSLSEKGEPQYNVLFNKSEVIKTSTLGLEFTELNLTSNFKISNTKVTKVNKNWVPIWGQESTINDNHNQLKVELVDNNDHKIILYFKVFDEGFAFRYHIPKQKNLDKVIITDENSQFNFTANHKVWWIPGDWDSYEHNYTESKISDIDNTPHLNNAGIAMSMIPDLHSVNTPVTMKTDDDVYIAIHEAALVDYAGMTVSFDTNNYESVSKLVAYHDGAKVKTQTPFNTPWRVVMLSDDAKGLLENRMVLNLNEPNKIEDTSWIEPMLYSGIWWEIHSGLSGFGMESKDGEGNIIPHGATTENAKRYIDWNAEHGIRGLLIEGWNVGWEKWIGDDRDGIFDWVTPYPDYDLEEVAAYAKSKGVLLIGHQETSGDVRNYEKQMHKVYQLFEDNNIHAIKSGYVGTLYPKNTYHHGQVMVNHYLSTAILGAKHKIMIDIHEPIKPTGLSRTYPNLMSAEGFKGQEFNKGGGQPANHTTILPFTRGLAGPMDYTPGVLVNDGWVATNNTIANELALYMIIYSPIQMVADIPDNYKKHPEAFEFIKNVAVDWEVTKILDAEIAEYIVIARKEKGNKERWFIGAVTDENKRDFEIKLDFLEKGETYEATIYKDGKDAHYKKNQTSIEIEKKVVSKNDTLNLKLAQGGGSAIVIEKIK